MKKLTVKEFVELVEDIFQNMDYNPEIVHPILANDEYSSDEELLQLFVENGEDQDTIEVLLELRDYFLDFNYEKELN